MKEERSKLDRERSRERDEEWEKKRMAREERKRCSNSTQTWRKAVVEEEEAFSVSE